MVRFWAVLAALILSLSIFVRPAEAANPTIVATLSPAGHTVCTATIDLTVNGVVQGNIAGGVCTPSPLTASGTMSGSALPNDATVNSYICDGGAATTLVIPSPTLVLGQAYLLQCPSPGGTVAPASGNPATDALIVFRCAASCPSPPVGGVAEPADLGALPPAAATGDASSSARGWYVAAAALGGALVLAAGVWFAKRRA